MHREVETRVNARQTLALSILFGTMYFVQGIGEPTEGLLSQPVKSILKSGGYGADAIASFCSLMLIPWFIKPLYGLMSDFLPIGGYRRHSYLAVTCGVAAVSYLALFVYPIPTGSWWGLLMAILVPTTAIAWSSVVVDALMVEWGQPRGITGRLQSVQWAAMWLATVMDGSWGGYLSQRHVETSGFLVCGLLSAGIMVLALTVVREPEVRLESDSFHEAVRTLWNAVQTPAVLLVGAFLFIWSFNPFSTSILYWRLTNDLNLSEQTAGDTTSVFALGAVMASAGYGLYCRRVRFGTLLRASIICGSISTLAYWALVDRSSAFTVSFAVGFFHMTGLIVTLDLAARSCPIRAAGTIFATLMALTNISSSMAGWVGGKIYVHAVEQWGAASAFHIVVVAGSVLPLACWALVPPLSRTLAAKQHWDDPPERPE